MRSAAYLVLVAAVIALPGCGASRTTTVAKTVVADHPPSSIAPVAARDRHAGTAVAQPAKRGPAYRACDPNISVKSATTTCPFAENAFYEYWKSGGAPVVRAYSPAAKATFRTTCATVGAVITCTTADGGALRFARSAVESYSSSQAAAYRAGADLGPGSSAAPPSGGAADISPAASSPSPPSAADVPPALSSQGASPAPSNDGPTPANEIPNYDNGTGSVVQCADGMYSHSGGRPGACSGHGGEG